MEKLSISFTQSYLTEIIIEKGSFWKGEWFDYLAFSNRFVIITDKVVEKLYGVELKKKLEKCQKEVCLISVPVGEKSKTREWKEKIEDFMIAHGLGRDCGVIALGGGMILDLAGFVAATYCRGVPLVSIPTTLIGQLDACLGGKVSINTPHGKNLIGAYHPVRFVLIDSEMLETLPPKEIQCGMAEVIKYALIASKELFEKLETSSLDELIYAGCKIKKEIVEQDFKEKGLRRLINFGHTLGHAIETASDYQLNHGEAVAIGMMGEAFLSFRMGYLDEKDLNRIEEMIGRFQFSLFLPCKIEDVLKVMKRDKKALGTLPRFVMLKEIGQTMFFDGNYCTAVNFELLKEMFAWLQSKSLQVV